jgi:NAD(P)-dependent dehydrogenase (short-subunit alcohol dehydrogenase family)
LSPPGKPKLVAVEAAVVTGAGQGLGRAIAHRLAERGGAVLIADVNGEAARRTASELPSAEAFELDVRDREACRAAASRARELGRLTVWVNNAGVLAPEAESWTHSTEAVERMIAVNLTGVVHGSLAAVEAMRESGGRILNVTSMMALDDPHPGIAVYGATKHAAHAFSVSLRQELEHAGIRIEVKLLCPDRIATAMCFDNVPGSEEEIRAQGGLLEPEEVAQAAMELLDGDRKQAIAVGGRIERRVPAEMIPTYRKARGVYHRIRRRVRPTH